MLYWYLSVHVTVGKSFSFIGRPMRFPCHVLLCIVCITSILMTCVIVDTGKDCLILVVAILYGEAERQCSLLE